MAYRASTCALQKYTETLARWEREGQDFGILLKWENLILPVPGVRSRGGGVAGREKESEFTKAAQLYQNELVYNIM